MGGLSVILRTLLLLIASTWVRAGIAFFRKLGVLGLFLLGACDSSFLFLPFSNDLLLIALVSRSQSSWHWVSYSLAAALGSVVGVMLMDTIMRKAGKEGLEKFAGAKNLEKLQGKIES